VQHEHVEADVLTGEPIDVRTALRARDVSAVEVVEGFLARIEELNPHLNAIVTLCADDARAAAAAADRATEPRPLHGVPFVCKDVIATAGVRSTAGSLILRDFVPTADATAVARLKAAGAILLGKTNCPEFALDPYTDNRLFGPTLNPRDESVTPGGSSGGDAAAIAAGMAVFGLGSDYGGSIRWPAQCCGIAGLRPTVGLVPLTGALPFPPSTERPVPSSAALLHRLQTFGPLARRVDDLWAVLRAVAGPDGVDPNTVPVPLGDPSALERRSLPVAWMDGEGAHPVDPDLVATVAAAASRLEGLGLRVEQTRPQGLEHAVEIFRAYRLADGLPVHAALADGHEDELAETMRNWFATARRDATVSEFQEIAERRDRLRAGVLEFMEGYPILLAPVSLGPAWKVGSADFAARFHNMAPCWAITLLGLPAAAVTVGTTPDGQAAAVQVVGRPFHDHEVIAVATMLEEQRDG
jgi:Asp-tRNA(Asn)/Glu-tRNA(Gln) amidotransferase A subunit family amidase